MIRAAVVGCGKMADQHVCQLRRLRNVSLVAGCDAEPLMARQFSERHYGGRCFSDVGEMLAVAKPDVVHVTTPPQTHHRIALACIDAGAHVYVEKPFTVNAAEAVDLLKRADERSVLITVGHNAQFTDAMLKMRKLVAEGALGGPPVHVDSLFCYELGDPAYARALLGDSSHWARSLPGSLVHNIMSHGVSKIAEWLSGDEVDVKSMAFTSRLLSQGGDLDVIDELRLLIRDVTGTTASFTFSTQICPPQHSLRIFGPRGSLFVDDDLQIVLRRRHEDYKSYLRLFVPTANLARQYVGELAGNVSRFAQRRLHLPNDAGLCRLIAQFYQAVADGGEPPIPYREILLTSRIMDAAFTTSSQHSRA